MFVKIIEGLYQKELAIKKPEGFEEALTIKKAKSFNSSSLD